MIKFNGKQHRTVDGVLNAVRDVIMPQINTMVINMGEELSSYANNIIKTDWYDKKSGSLFYESTGMMLNSITYQGARTEDKFRRGAAVFYQPNLVRRLPAKTTLFKDGGYKVFLGRGNYWPSAISIVDGSNFDDMPHIIEKGWTVSFHRFNTHRPGVAPIGNAKQHINTVYTNALNSLDHRVSSMGWTIKR